MQEVLVNRLGGLSLSRKSVVRLTDRPDMTLDVYRGRKTTMQQRPRYPHPVCSELEKGDIVAAGYCSVTAVASAILNQQNSCAQKHKYTEVVYLIWICTSLNKHNWKKVTR